MTDNSISFESMLKLVCGDIASESGLDFDELDVSATVVSADSRKKFKTSLNRILFSTSAFGKSLKRALIACAVLVALMLLAIAAVEPLREGLWELITQKNSEYIEVSFVPSGPSADIDESAKFVLPELPDGWSVESKEVLGENNSVHIIETDKGGRLVVSKMSSDADLSFDSLSNLEKEIKLSDGTIAYLFRHEDGNLNMIWQNHWCISVKGVNVTEEELISFAYKIG